MSFHGIKWVEDASEEPSLRRNMDFSLSKQRRELDKVKGQEEAKDLKDKDRKTG